MDSVKSESATIVTVSAPKTNTILTAMKTATDEARCGARTHDILVRRLPIVEWLPKYRLSYLQYDLVSGITAAITVVPQAMAYAYLAGLPLEYGLYTCFMGLFAYCVFGTREMIHVGPTSMMALLVAEYVQIGGPAYAIWLSFLGGCVEIIFSVLNLGTLLDFISLPVISGFSSAASVIVIVNLCKNIFGISIPSSHCFQSIYLLIIHISETNIWDLGFSTVCIVVLIIMKNLNDLVKKKGKSEAVQSVWRRLTLSVLWFIFTARNAFVVLAASTVSYFMIEGGMSAMTVSDKVKSGMPSFSFPSLHVDQNGNTVTFFQMFGDFYWGVILMPFVAIIQHIAIAKSFADGKSVDASQEVIALGFCNILGSFVGAFPVAASFSRTALNVSTGIKTTLASSFTAILVLASLACLQPTFRYIPKPTLAAVVVTAVAPMIEYQIVPQLWKTKRSDLAVWFTTFSACVILDAELGIMVGIAVSLLVLLYSLARPGTAFHKSHGFDGEFGESGEFLVVEPDRAMYFPSIEYIRYKLNHNIVLSDNYFLPVIFDGSLVSGFDYTAAEGIKRLVEDFKKQGVIIIFTNFKEKVLRIIQSTNPEDFVHCKTMDEIGLAVQGYHRLKSSSEIEPKSSKSDLSLVCEIESLSSTEAHVEPTEPQTNQMIDLNHVSLRGPL